MKILHFFLFLCCAAYIEALDCDVSMINTENLSTAISECIIDGNKTLIEIWENIVNSGPGDDNNHDVSDNSNSSESADDSSISSYEEKLNDSFKNHPNTLPTEKSIHENDTSQSNSRKNYEKLTSIIDQDAMINKRSDVDDSCVLQCIFEKLELTDRNGYPERHKIFNRIREKITQSEMQEFVYDSVDQCFQEVEEEDTSSACRFVLQFTMCLSTKGKSRCDNWPVEKFPLGKLN